jgi:hypothetical protein
MKFLAGLALAVTVSQTAEAAEVRIVQSSDSYTVEELERAVDAFRIACPRLGSEWWPEFTEITVETSAEYAAHRLGRGWKTNIHLALRIPDETDLIPASTSEAG